MKVTVIQSDIVWRDKAANLENIGKMIAGCGTTDLIVLPEMFSTGFCMEAAVIAESDYDGGEVLPWMRRIAEEKNAAVTGSVAVKSGEMFFNRMYFVQPDGIVAHYDKRHLFGYSGENLHYSPGNRRRVICFRGVRILLQVCYDLRFPVWSRNCGDYDLAVYAASWPVNRIAAWDLLLRARAWENKGYVVGENRVGDDPICRYPGHSVIIHPYGNVMTELRDGETGCITADIDMEWLRGFREKFPVLHDADRFHIEK